MRAPESTIHCPGWNWIMGKSKLFSFSASCITFAKPNLEWVIWICNVFSVTFAYFLRLENQISCITSERCREGQSLGYFPAIFSLLASLISHLFVLLRTFAFCVHLIWQQWERKWPNGKCHLARFGKEGSVNFHVPSSQSSSRLKLYQLCPSLRCPGTPVSSCLGRIRQGMHQRLCPQHPEDVDVCGIGGWVKWESMALLCSSSRTHDIMPVMSIASNNIRDISWCTGADSITGRSPSWGGTSSTGLHLC